MNENVSALLIEDDEEDVFLFKKITKTKSCCSITHCGTLNNSIKELEKNSFDVILLDLNLPDSKGLETLKKIKSQIDNTPIIILTGLDDDQTAIEAIRQGAQDYISKSDIDYKTINKAVYYSIERQRLLTMLHQREEKINTLYKDIENKNKELLQLSIKDPLTNVYNRRFLEEHLKIEFHKSRRYMTPLFFLICDVDHFKQINDTYGHAAGDKVLKKVAEILESVTRDSDTVGRFGGDEFCIFGHQNKPGAQGIIKRVLSSLENTIIDDAIKVTMSLGAAILTETVDSVEKLQAIADEALYQAKEQGRNRGFVNENGRTIEVLQNPISEDTK